MQVALNAWFWNSPTTGSGQYTRRLVEHLAALDADLRIVLVAPHDRIPTPSPSIPNVQPCPTSTRFRWPSDLAKVWFEQVSFPRRCRELKVDIAHVPYWAPPLAPPVPTLVTIHDLIPLLLRQYRGGALVRLYTALVSTTAQNAALVLTDSRASCQDIIDHLGLPPQHVRVVYLAADERYTAHPAPDDDRVRAHYDLPERYVLYLGGFDVRKNVAAVLSAYRQAGPSIGQECSLVVAGRLPERDTPFTPDPRRLAREMGIDGQRVRFIGSPTEAEKPVLYRGAVVFVFPSRYEGFGLPPLEALACGTPVVGSDASSIPEVVGNAGVLLPPDDAEGMAGALIQLAVDDDFYAELSRRALAQAARFSWERVARETLAAYREVGPDSKLDD